MPSSPEIITDKAAMRAWSREHRAAGRTVALVPTMGCLHAGHLSLVDIAKKEADVVAVSIYVNPTQFAAHEDFGVYPRTREADRSVLAAAGVDAIFEPASLYEGGGSDAALVVGAAGDTQRPPPGAHETTVTVPRLSTGLCGASRPHFFAGVATVVAKLFNCVDPDVAVFGRKDFQQLAVVTRMARDLDFAVRVVGGPIARGRDGLALSSRNALLTAEDRAAAPAIAAALAWAASTAAAAPAGAGVPASHITDGVRDRIRAARPDVRVDYVSVVDATDLTPVARVGPRGGWVAEGGGGGGGEGGGQARPALLAVAAFFGKVRLIDNTVLSDEVDEGLAGLGGGGRGAAVAVEEAAAA